ncbi:MAG: B12-binding domain-containing radical SAM protein [Deltaproteobacteria bacterium]|nr:B12-binding domain-containing radical SAM protein [Deltaproteobacteria bacterium]
MKVIFIQNILSYNFGIAYLNAILKSAGIQTDLFIISLEKKIIQKIIQAKPDLIGISCVTGEQGFYLNLIREVKKDYKVPVVIGGPHATYHAEEICKQEGVDFVCIGEGEQSILELCSSLSSNKDGKDVHNLCMFRNNKIIKNPMAPLVEDLDSLPFPNLDFYFKYHFFKNYTEMPIVTTRGCPWNCGFCYNAQKQAIYKGLGKYVRMRSPEKVIAELKERLVNKNIKSVILWDDIIGINKKWMQDFCERYSAEIGLPFFSSIRADLVNDFNLSLLKKANCYCLSIGVESGDSILRKQILGKDIEDESLLNAGKLVRKYGIKLRTSNMFMLPEENLEKALTTVELNQKMGAEIPFAYILQPYPGTPIYDYITQNNLLADTFSFDSLDPLGISYSSINIKIDNADNIKTIYKLFYYMVRSQKLCKFIVKIIDKLKPENILVNLAHNLSLFILYCKAHNVSYLNGLKVTWVYWRIDRNARKRLSLGK